MQLLGERIRRKRESLQMQLNDMAKKVGVSSSALSQIEKAKSFPSIVTLKAIADSLHTTVGDLIGENETLEPLVKFANKSFVEVNESGASLYLLSNHSNNKLMDTFLVEFPAHSNSSDILKNHPGQEFCFVLEGTFEIKLEDKVYRLQKNDSFYFNSNRQHSVHNVSNGVAQLIWIVTPPGS